MMDIPKQHNMKNWFDRVRWFREMEGYFRTDQFLKLGTDSKGRGFAIDGFNQLKESLTQPLKTEKPPPTKMKRECDKCGSEMVIASHDEVHTYYKCPKGCYPDMRFVFLQPQSEVPPLPEGEVVSQDKFECVCGETIDPKTTTPNELIIHLGHAINATMKRPNLHIAGDQLKKLVEFQNYLQVQAVAEASKYNFSHKGRLAIQFIVDKFREYLDKPSPSNEGARPCDYCGDKSVATLKGKELCKRHLDEKFVGLKPKKESDPLGEGAPSSNGDKVKCSVCGTTEKVYELGVKGTDVALKLCMNCLKERNKKPSESQEV